MFWFVLGVATAMPLHKAIGEALSDEVLEGTSVSVVVWDDEGNALVALDPDRRMVPASTVKWITAIAAAETLSLDHRFETTLAATGYTEQQASGQGDETVLVGDLVIIGGGDPTLGEGDPQRFVTDVAAILREGGIARITGDVVVDGSRFDGPLHGPGWMWDDFVFPYSAPFGAVNYAHNLQVDAQCPAYGGPGTPIVDPPACLAAVVREGLARDGIVVSGVSRVARHPEAAMIGAIWSAPMRDLVRTMLSRSDNLYAECIARSLDQGAPFEASVAGERLAGVLAAAGINGGTRVVDGSGLSRYSLVSADALVRLSAWVQTRPYGEELGSLLPLAGREGTLASRMVGTPAEGRVRAKSGSMSGVRNLVGHVDTADGQRLFFAVLINGITGPQPPVVAVQDRVVAFIAASNGRRLPRRVAAGLASGG